MASKVARSRVGRLSLALFLVVGMLLGASMAGATAAHAASVWASGDPILIDVQTGAKNYSNHTQWVSSITIYVPTASNYGYGRGKFEVWTQNFYATWQGQGDQEIPIQTWVGTGNYVCGAFTPANTAWPRAVACIGISV